MSQIIIPLVTKQDGRCVLSGLLANREPPKDTERNVRADPLEINSRELRHCGSPMGGSCGSNRFTTSRAETPIMRSIMV